MGLDDEQDQFMQPRWESGWETFGENHSLRTGVDGCLISLCRWEKKRPRGL